LKGSPSYRERSHSWPEDSPSSPESITVFLNFPTGSAEEAIEALDGLSRIRQASSHGRGRHLQYDCSAVQGLPARKVCLSLPQGTRQTNVQKQVIQQCHTLAEIN